jgi:thiol-disulfide isomerase/thioredoxin
MKKNIIIIIVVILILILIGIFSFGKLGEKNSLEMKNDSEMKNNLENLTFLNYQEELVSLSDFNNKAKVLNSWASWCPFCKKELPDFVKIQEEFPEIVVMAINRKESKEELKDFLEKENIEEKILFLLDEEDSFYSTIGGFSMPETIFLDKDNNIVFHQRGIMTYKQMKEKVLIINK